MNRAASCEVQGRFGNCTQPHDAFTGWALLAVLVVCAALAAVQWHRNRRHVPKHAPGYREPTPPVSDNPEEPRAASRVWAFVTASPPGLLCRLFGPLASAMLLTQQPSSGIAGSLFAPRCTVEVRDLHTGAVLAIYDWRRNPRGAKDHADSLNRRARSMALSHFLQELGLQLPDASMSRQT